MESVIKSELWKKQFDWTEYIVFALMLCFSALIGVFYGCYQKQNTVDGYLLGNKRMSVFPIAMSLVASTISGVTLMGVPSEIYSYGAHYWLLNVANLLVCFVTLIIFLPVFYRLQLVSLYEYLELRFNAAVRKTASFLFGIAYLFYIPIVIYGPALAFNQVSGISIYIIAPIICTVCIFYTTLGGLKAVVWADALQGSVMLLSLVIVAGLGLIRAGGFYAIFEAAHNGERLHIDMNPDPRLRISFWSIAVGVSLQWIPYTATSPASVQRFISLPTYRQAQMSVLCWLLGVTIFGNLSVFMGFVMYAVYKDCDPISSKLVDRQDQILPYFILDIAGHLKGLPGLFVAGIVCAALSTLSTGLNTLAGTIYEDFIEPNFRGKINDKRASDIMKILVVFNGIICVIMVNVVEKMGNIIDMTSAFGGLTAGATLGIFTLGVLFPWANSKCVLTGGLVALAVMSGAMIGNNKAKQSGQLQYITKPFSIENCSFINSTITEAVNSTIIFEKEISGDLSRPFYLFEITVFYYGFLGFSISAIVGIIVSFLTGPNRPIDVDPKLLSPLIHRYLPKKSQDYTAVYTSNNIHNNVQQNLEK